MSSFPKDNKEKALVAAGVAAVGILGYFFYKSKKASAKPHHALPGSKEDDKELKIGKGVHVNTEIEVEGAETLLKNETSVAPAEKADEGSQPVAAEATETVPEGETKTTETTEVTEPTEPTGTSPAIDEATSETKSAVDTIDSNTHPANVGGVADKYVFLKPMLILSID